MLDIRDRAILRTFVYSGVRLATVCRLKVSDLHQDGDEATLRLHEKGNKRHTIGNHYSAAQALPNTLKLPASRVGRSFVPARDPEAKSLLRAEWTR